MDPVELIQQGKIKRYFRATRKLTAPWLVSHLTQRAAGKEPLFVEDGDYLFMLASLKKIAQKRSLTIFAFCLMPNHVHLLLRPEADDLIDAMRDLFSRYAAYFNRKYHRKGHLFGGPYRQAVCLDDGYLIAASLYIHNNPVKAGICDAPGKYRWSTSQLYCGEKMPDSFVCYEYILDLVGGKNAGKATYRKMLNRCREFDAGMVLEEPGALDGFRKKVAALFPKVFAPLHWVNMAKDDIDLIDRESLEAQLDAVRTGLTGGRAETLKAKRFLIQQLISRGYNKTEIAKMMGISRKSVYNLLASDSKVNGVQTQ